MYEFVTIKTNLWQQAATHSQNPRHPTYEYESNALLADHEDPSKVNTLTLILKISRHNKQQLLAKLDFLHKYIIIYVSHQQQEFGFNRNSRCFIPSPAPYHMSIKILE